MKHNFIWILAGLIFIGPLGIASMSLAAEDTWTKKTDMPTARYAFSTNAVNGKIYAIGGEVSLGAAGLPTVEEYDPTTDTWTRRADMPTARGFLSTSAVNGKIYAIGGSTGAAPSFVSVPTVEVYDTGFAPPEVISSVNAEGKLPTTWGEIKRSR